MILNDITKEVDPGAYQHLEDKEIVRKVNQQLIMTRRDERETEIYTHTSRESMREPEKV